MNLLKTISSKLQDSPLKPTKKEILIREYMEWDNVGRSSDPTARVLTGYFWLQYKQRHSITPPSDLKADIRNFQFFLDNFMKEDPSLAPYVIDYFFGLKGFNGLQPSSFTNPNILTKWGAFQNAEKIRNRFGVGEQSEFRTDPKNFGVRFI